MRRHSRTAGFTLIEAMLTLTVLSVAGIAVPVALRSLARVPPANDRILAVSAELASELDYWRAAAWGGSPWPASLPYSASGAVTLRIGGANVSLNRTVSIQTWDPNNLAGNSSPQADFARVQVTIDGQTSVAYLPRPL